MFRESQQIGLYTLIRRLGRGGFGEVWLAENRSHSPTEKVAIKLPRTDQIDLQSVKEEIFNWILSGRHKNILPIIECEIFGNQIAIVSEYAPGGSLQDLINKKGSLPASEAVEIAVGILDGLAHLHNRQIIHRDLKPDNVLFQGNVPRLTDFGISRAMTVTSQSQTVSGTLSYMAPEAFDGKRNAQTDIWAVGVILYQLLTANLPFPQKEKVELIGALVMKEPAPLPASIPPDLQTIIKKALAKESSHRYQTAAEMAKELLEFSQKNSEATLKMLLSGVPPTEPSPTYEIPLNQPSPIIVKPVRDKSDSVVTNVKVPFENYETETTFRSVLPQKPKNNLNIYLFSTIGLIFVIIGVIYFSNGNKTELTNTISNENSKTSPTSTSSPIVVGNNMTTSNNENTSINVVNTNSNKTEELRQQLKKELGTYLNAKTKFFLKDNGNSAKGKTTVKKSFYKDVDNDGLEDAVFLLQGYLEQSDYFWDGFVFYRNDGERFVFGGDHFFGGAEYITVKKFEVKTGSIYAEVELLEGGENDGKIENYTFVVKNNRIEKK